MQIHPAVGIDRATDLHVIYIMDECENNYVVGSAVAATVFHLNGEWLVF